MINKKSVIVGMSGGVDSSLASWLLKEQGYEVEGRSFILFDKQSRKGLGKMPCCSIEALMDAHKTARAIGIRHDFVDVRETFMERVVKPFIDGYARGLTPNPCILCNRYIKFPSLIRAADEKGFGFIATGHYARVDREGQRLLRGLDTKKDQSYVLYSLARETIGRLILPLGEKTKVEVKAIARGLNLAAAKRPESQEICFIEERDYVSFMEGLAAGREGAIIDIETGKVLSDHKGIHLYTIGQRKRLSATGKPVYVIRIDPSENAVYIGPREMAMMREFTVGDINWLADPGSPRIRTTVKVRSMMKDEPATIHVIDGSTVRIEYDEPQWAPAPGQSAVFYSGDAVLGGGVISPFTDCLNS